MKREIQPKIRREDFKKISSKVLTMKIYEEHLELTNVTITIKIWFKQIANPEIHTQNAYSKKMHESSII